MVLTAFDVDQITVRPWDAPVSGADGFDPRSPYVEKFWLGVLGPSACWLLRRVAAGFDAAPDGFAMPLGETARALGLGDRGGRNSAFFRTLNRLVQFGIARPAGPSELLILRKLPPLSARQAARLPEDLQEAHQRWHTQQPLPWRP